MEWHADARHMYTSSVDESAARARMRATAIGNGHGRPVPALPKWVVVAVAVGTFIDLSGIIAALPVLASIRAPFLLFAAGMLGLLLNTPAWRPRDARRSRMFRYLGVVLAVAILGVPFALVSYNALFWLRDHYLKVLIQGAMLWAVSRRSEDRLFVVRTIILAALWACVAALLGPRGDGGRIQGPFYDANSMAVLANLLLPLLAWYAYDRRNRWRWLSLVALPIPCLTLVLSGSRGGFLAFGAMLLSTSLLFTPRAPRPLRRLFPIAAVLGVVGVAFAPSSVIERVTTMLDGSDYNYSAETGRIGIWKRGLGYALTHPLFGVGVVNFPAAEGFSETAQSMARQGVGFARNVAHSTYVESLAELGLIGGGAFVLLIFLTARDLLKRGRTAARTRDPEGILVGTLAISFVGFAAAITFLSYTYFPLLYILYGIAYGYFDALDAPPSARRGRPLRLRRRTIGQRPFPPVISRPAPP